jgi:N-acyl-D-amino-acid deacylase
MFRPRAIAEALQLPGPPSPVEILRYMLGQPLQFAPGSWTVYSNFGYSVLGRVIEKVSGQSYLDFVRREVLAPAGITSVTLGRTLPADRDPREPFYSDPARGPNVLAPARKEMVPAPDGTFHLEALDAHGGLIGSASDLVRFLNVYQLDGQPVMAKPAPGCYFGSLPGTFTLLIQRADGVKIAALFNQRIDPSGRDYQAIRAHLDKAADSIQNWPT